MTTEIASNRHAGSSGPEATETGAVVAVEGSRRRSPLIDVAVIVGFLLIGFVLVGRLWKDVDHRYLAFSVADQQGFEWIIANVTHAVTHGQNPLFTHAINAPFGINVMAQTSIIGLTLPLLPVTLLFGPAATFTVLLSLALGGTSAAWYWVFRRHLVASRTAAAVAGGLCGLAPPMISHANGGHVNYVAQFALPFIVLWTVKLREPGRWLRNGVVLGLLVTYQIFVGEEPLLLCALGLAGFVLTYAVMRWSEVRAQLRTWAAGMGVAAVVTGVLAGYPLWWQFRGPQSYSGIPHAVKYGNDILALTTFASQSLGGMRPVGDLAMNPTEENGFFGWPVLLLALVAAVWLWRRSVVARAAAVTTALALIASLGVEVFLDHKDTGVPGPWRVATHLPLVGSILPSRMTFVAIPAIAALLALATDRVLALAREARQAGTDGAGSTGRALRLLWLGALAAVLVPIAPTPVDAVGRADAPRFFSDGTWRQYVAPGRSVLAVPPPDGSYMRPVRWQIAADMGFNLVEGYFIGPHGADHHGWYGSERLPTADLLNTVWRTGTVPAVTDEQRRVARENLRFWKADAVVLGPGETYEDALKQTADALFGPGRKVGDVWVWDVRSVTR